MHVFVHENTKACPVCDLEPQCLPAVLHTHKTAVAECITFLLFLLSGTNTGKAARRRETGARGGGGEWTEERGWGGWASLLNYSFLSMFSLCPSMQHSDTLWEMLLQPNQH